VQRSQAEKDAVSWDVMGWDWYEAGGNAVGGSCSSGQCNAMQVLLSENCPCLIVICDKNFHQSRKTFSAIQPL
jgi:hypothetical protein